jgi:hypothetical protein
MTTQRTIGYLRVATDEQDLQSGWKKGTFVRTNVPHLIEKVCYTGNVRRLGSVRQRMQVWA